LIFIMTPHIVRNEADMARLVAEEARKMSWSLKDVECIHGYGMDVLSGGRNGPGPGQPGYCPPGTIPTPGSGGEGQPIPVPVQPQVLPSAEAKSPKTLPNVSSGPPATTSVFDNGWNPVSLPPTLPGMSPTVVAPVTPSTKAKEGQASWESVKR
jgi:hypothetical protein